MQYQTTLRDAIEFEGNGLHTGLPARVRVFPARAGSGIFFRLDGTVMFPARGRYVVDTRRCTVLGYEGQTVSTVEHLLSAITGMGIDNVVIDVEGPEIPVMDGSAKVFIDAIDAVGTVHSSEPRRRYIPTQTRLFRDAEKLLVVAPSSSLRIRFTVDYAQPIGTQYLDAEITPEFYRDQIAPARTFGFLHEVESLIRRGLAQGGSLENAIVFGPDGPLAPLRLPDEVVRHKILDLIGDFALLGAWPQCEVISIKSGHKLHCTCVRDLEQEVALTPAAAVGP